MNGESLQAATGPDPRGARDLQLLREIVGISNKANSFESALELALPRIARHHDWKAAQAFVLAGDSPEQLILCKTYYEALPELFTRLHTPPRQDLEHSGYLRQVVENKLPMCTTTTQGAMGARGAAALEAGLCAAAAIPVLLAADVVAVLECFADRAIESDASILDSMAGLGVALGRPLERERGAREFSCSERLTSLGSFAAGIAHELNNPLSAILVSARVARRQNYDKEQLHEIIDEIIADTERCAQIVRSLVKFARDEPGDRKPVQVSELLRRVVGISRRAAEQQRVALELGITEPLPPVLANATELEQALVSVIDTAIRSSAPGGAIRVHATETGGTLRILLSGGGSEDGSRQARVCTLSPGRIGHPVGLNLAMAQGMITRHGGQIRIDTCPGIGITIVIELPAGEQPVGRVVGR